jgi:cytochrome d ubiquinol oxidase subunit II
MDIAVLPNVAFFMFLFFFAVYSILDGFALGIGCLMPFVRDRRAADRIVSYIAPFWEANEVWLVMGVGFMYAAFPSAFSILLPVFYLPFMATIAAFILRGAGLEFSYHDPAHVRGWRVLFGIGSFLAALAGMLALGFMIHGLPFAGPGEVSGAVFDSLSAFPLVFGVTGLALLVWHGIAFVAGKGPPVCSGRSATVAWGVALLLSLATGYLWMLQDPLLRTKPVACVGGGMYLLGLGVGRPLLARGAWAFRGSSLSIAGFWVLAAASLFPNLLPAKNDASWSISIQAAAAPASSLRAVVALTPALILLIIGYTSFIHRVIKRPDRTGR